MQKILNKIKNIELYGENEALLKSISIELKKYYDENKGRHSYSDVSAFIYDSDPGDFEYIIENLQIIGDYYERDVELQKYAKSIYKLLDHINLEIKREDHIAKLKESNINQIVLRTMSDKFKEIENLKRNFDTGISDKIVEMKDSISDIEFTYKELLSKQRKEIEGLNNNIISILGIFSAVILSFFGGLSILGSVLQNMHNVSKYRLSLVIILISFFMFNIIFMLINYIAKLIDKDISTIKKCEKNICAECDNRISIKCLRKRFPIVYIFNLLCLVSVSILFAMFIVDKYNIIAFFMGLYGIKNESYVAIIGGGIVVITAVIVIIIRKTMRFRNNQQKASGNISI